MKKPKQQQADCGRVANLSGANGHLAPPPRPPAPIPAPAQCHRDLLCASDTMYLAVLQIHSILHALQIAAAHRNVRHHRRLLRVPLLFSLSLSFILSVHV
jgi:hypothetical protein